MRRNEDSLWKGILEDTFDDFIRLVDPAAAAVLDLERGFDFLDKELQQVYPPEESDYSLKIVDKLVKVYTKKGQEEYILVHVEIQGQYREDFGKRMFSYYYRLFDKYDKPITAYTIFTEATTTARSDIFRMELLGTIMNYKFNIYKIADQNDAELMASDNPFALVVLAAKTVLSGKNINDSEERDQLFFDVKTDLIRQLLSKRLTKLKIRKILEFINYYINFDSSETNIKFEKELKLITSNKSTMGILEVVRRIKKEEIKIGLALGREQVIHNLILKLNLSDEQICDIVPVRLNFVKKQRAKLNNNTPNAALA